MSVQLEFGKVEVRELTQRLVIMEFAQYVQRSCKSCINGPKRLPTETNFAKLQFKLLTRSMPGRL